MTRADARGAELGYDALNRQVSWSDGTKTETTTYRGAAWHRHAVAANDGTTTAVTAFLHDADDVALLHLISLAYAFDPLLMNALHITP